MSQPDNILIIIFLILYTTAPSIGAIKGGLEYNIPVDYSKINEAEINEKAEFFYTQALNNSSQNVTEEMTSALNLYSVLSNKNPENIIYTLRLGKLYQTIGKDRYAKGNFYKAISIAPQKPEGYFYLAEYFFSRNQYRKALKYYKEAYNKGYNSHPQTLARLREIYRKLGDTKALESLNS